MSAKIPAKEAFSKIARVSEWWNRRSTGNAHKVGDTFKVDFGDTWVDFKIIEAVPSKRIVWQVTDCYLHWLKNKTERKDAKVIGELAAANEATRVTMTHKGLTPSAECFKDCEAGWNFYIGKSLLKLFTDDRGLPDRK